MDLDIEISKDGYKILKIVADGKSKFIGSKYNQKAQIESFLKNLGDISEKDNFIIFGLGFCEHIIELLNCTRLNNKILIVESNKVLIEYCKKDKDIRKILTDQRIILGENIDDLRNFFLNYINEGNINFLKIESYCNSLNILWDDYRELYIFIKNEMSKLILNRNTVLANGSLYLNNFLNNLIYIAKNSKVNCLRNKYKNRPAIIVSAGPSLSKNINALKAVDNAVILTGARTLNALIEKEIHIDCLGVVDPNNVSYELIKDSIGKIEYPLFFNDSTPNEILENHKGKKFFALQNNYLKSALKDEIPSLYGGGSIAHSLTNLALYMGCNPIIFIGQDLAYTNDKKHDKLAEHIIDNCEVKNNDEIYVEDIYGMQIKTSFELNVYRKNLEDIIEKNNHIKFINATEGGAKIEGTSNKKLSEVIKSLPKENILSIDNYLIDSDKSENIILCLNKTLKECDKFLELCEKGINIIKNLKLSYLKETERKLDALHKEIYESLSNIELLNPELSQIIYKIEGDVNFIALLTDSDKEVLNKKLEKLNDLYTGFVNIINKNYLKIKIIIMKLQENDIGG